MHKMISFDGYGFNRQRCTFKGIHKKVLNTTPQYVCYLQTHSTNTDTPVIWQTRQHYRQHYSAMRENMPSGQIPGFATFDPDNTCTQTHNCKSPKYNKNNILYNKKGANI